jgi:two-component system sensor histidine kinase YesM
LITRLWNFIDKSFRRILMKGTGSLVNKLILLFTSIILLIAVSFTLTSYKMLEQESARNNIASNSNTLKLVNQSFQDYFEEIEKLALPSIKYDETLDAIKNEPSDYLSQIFLEDYLRNLFYSGKDIECVMLYLIPSQKSYYLSRSDIFGGVKSFHDPMLPRSNWYRRTIGSTQNSYTQSLFPFKKAGFSFINRDVFMAYHRTIINITYRQPVAVLSIYFNAWKRDQILKGIPVNPGEHVALLDSGNNLFYIDDQQYSGLFRNGRFLKQIRFSSNLTFNWRIDQNKYLVVGNMSPGHNWKLIKLIPYSLIYQTARTNRNLSFLIGGIFLAVAIILVTITSQAITLRLKKLAATMERFSNGNFKAEVKINGNDEIAQLAKQFNQMVKKIDDLINEEYKMKLTEKNAILKALEAEINPHFLYNALQAISTKALKNNASDISKMVDALASTFRYCISGKDIVTLEEEMKHVQNYLVLQKARFGNRLQIQLAVDNAALGVELPKLAIQTLVENSIKHALEKMSSTVTITLKVNLEGQKAHISVDDNGPGIVSERLAQIQNSLSQGWGESGNQCIGLTNLNTRLKLMFGDEFYLNLNSDQNGTFISFEVPQKEV